MSKRVLRKRPGRKSKTTLARPRRVSCRDCPSYRPRGGCRDSGLWSGRCGDYVWFVRHGKQLRRLWVKPNDPRTRKQRRYRARLSATSAQYSAELTDAQQDALIAAGAKVRCRPRLGPSGYQTGQQHWVHKNLKGKPDFNPRKRARFAKVPQSQPLPKKYTSQLPPPQPLTPTTWDTHRILTGNTPATHRPTTRVGVNVVL
jgi:hypothetical protein